VPDFEFIGPVVNITRQTGQSIVGFGGAFTEASAVVFDKLGAEQQRQVIEAYWGPDGIGYTVGRVHINSCDFSEQSYAFDDVDGDFELRHFDDSVARDARSLIPLILRAQAALRGLGRELRLLASPWSPPAWMKANRRMVHSWSPCLRVGAQAAWARYIARWISAYAARGVGVWAVTVQNEPEYDAQWEACTMTPEEEASFLAGALGPVLHAAHPEVLVFVYDHNKNHVLRWADAIYSQPAAQRHVDGVAFHWYTGDGFENLKEVHRRFPQALLLPSEATYERRRWREGATVERGEWSFGEGYAHDIIGDLNAGSVGWIDWNLILDESGGPNHVDNVCDAVMMANLTTGELFFHPQYYYIGHFSKYILPGSRRLSTTVMRTSHYDGKSQYSCRPEDGPHCRGYGVCGDVDGLQATAFLRPDGLVAMVALNCGGAPIDFKLLHGTRAVRTSIPAHGIQTYIFDAGEVDLVV